MAPQRRRRQLIAPGPQLRIVAYAVLVALIALIANLSLLVFGIESVFTGFPGIEADVQDAIRGAALKYSLLSAGLVVPLATCVGIFISLRIFGPIHRFERFISRIAEGDFSEACRLRRGDDLGHLEAAINRMVSRLRERSLRHRGAFAEILEGLEALEAELPEARRGRLCEIRRIAEDAIASSPRLEAAAAAGPSAREPVATA